MKSTEIEKSLHPPTPSSKTTEFADMVFWIKELAYQIAVLNEYHKSLDKKDKPLATSHYVND